MALPGPDWIFLLSSALLGHPPAALLLHMDVAPSAAPAIPAFPGTRSWVWV